MKKFSHRKGPAGSRNASQDSWKPDYGPHPKGYFVYDSTGHFALQFCAANEKPAFASGNDFTPTPDEAKAVISTTSSETDWR
jgi:hypothetical protein